MCLLAGCYRVPVTGRRAVNLVDSQDVVRLSVAAFEDLKRKYRPLRDKTRIAQLERVGERLSKVVFWDMPHAEWEFVIFDAPNEINAFAMAGGKVGVFSGLYKVASTDDELASVLAHEIAHVTAKHVDERLSTQGALETAGTMGAVGLGVYGTNPVLSNAVLNAYGLGAGLTGLAFDRSKELEADYIGLVYMARAGFNPDAAVTVLERLEEMTAGRAPVSFLSTHPSTPERIAKMTENVAKAREIQEKSAQRAAPVIVR